MSDQLLTIQVHRKGQLQQELTNIKYTGTAITELRLYESYNSTKKVKSL